MRKKKTRKRIKRTLREQQTAEERRALIEATKRRRGVRIDFTERKLNSRTNDTGKLSKIIRCGVCGKKGVVSNALAPSILIIHRGVIKDSRFSLMKNFDSDNPPHCVNSIANMKRIGR